ncbi:N-acetylmuramic acid 6-phosphate etherase [Branchiibius cervicis]|uniref:N-acetylmuramic acid 6-phosphate etherase n=1 Tax=Branchiibius cervicis TaxID=908252 RepID=A0ABW2AXM6_9MICO
MSGPPADIALGGLRTEQANPASAQLDSMTTRQMVDLMNAEDATVAGAVHAVLDDVARAADRVATALGSGGRLVYAGAGTSGRLGLLDAVECPPTFDTDPEQVVALLAGGPGAFKQAVEGAEDDEAAGARDVDLEDLGEHDVLVGLAASGRTPYVLGALRRARERGSATVSVACNRSAAISHFADVAIEVDTGPEVLTGSTRLKAGTAQKMVCNMLSTVAMVKIGKTYRNLMVDMRASNAKLADRAGRIVAQVSGVDTATARAAIDAAGGSAKVAIVMLRGGLNVHDAMRRLDAAGGIVAAAID